MDLLPVKEVPLKEIDRLKQQLAQIEAQIEEAEQRLPAHSVKPAMMAALFDLEDARQALFEALKAARSERQEPPPGKAD